MALNSRSFLLLLLCYFAAASALPISSRLLSTQNANNGKISVETQPSKLMATANTITQLVDHFDAENLATYEQRYWVNETFFVPGSNSAVFLCVGGETSLDADTAVTGEYHCAEMIAMAPQHNALIIALEHRYYGKSMPTKDFSTPNLRYLSSQQALSDLAWFVSSMNARYNLGSANKWVTFGGSYPGMLSAWARIKFPHLIHASVANSAPVKAQWDFAGYNDVCAASLSDPIVGGSAACADSIREANIVVGQALATASGRRTLEQKFNVCVEGQLDDTNNQYEFLSGLTGLYPIQENDPSSTAPLSNIQLICDLMTNTTVGDPFTRLVTLANALSGDQCTDCDWSAAVLAMQDATPTEEAGRQWLYQCCTEFAFWQTCDPDSKCIYTTQPWLNTPQAQQAFCQTSFGISSNTTTFRVDATNSYYGADRPAGSRILWANGSIDPWHALSVLVSPGPQQPVMMVPGSSHHFWTHVPQPTDSPAIMAARLKIAAQVSAWLEEP